MQFDLTTQPSLTRGQKNSQFHHLIKKFPPSLLNCSLHLFAILVIVILSFNAMAAFVSFFKEMKFSS